MRIALWSCVRNLLSAVAAFRFGDHSAPGARSRGRIRPRQQRQRYMRWKLLGHSHPLPERQQLQRLSRLISPAPASNSGQDNVNFITAPPGQTVNVTWEVEQIDITSSTGNASADSINIDFSGPATIPATPQTIDDDTPLPPPFAHTYTQNGVSPAGVQINIGPAPGGQQSFQVAQYRVKCTPAKGTLTINKVAIGGNGTFAVVATPTVGAATNYSIPTAGGTGSQSQDVTPDTYLISETPPAGWILDSIQCGNGPAGQTAPATVTANTTTTCTVTNRKKAAVTIKKETVGESEVSHLMFTSVPAGQGAIPQFTQTTSAGNNPSPGQSLTDLVPGSRSTETPPAGTWLLTTLTCDAGTGISGAAVNGFQGSFTLAPGASGTCTYKNTLQQANKGTIIINKTAVGGDDNFPFTGTGTGIPANFNIQTNAGAGSQTFPNLDPGTYTVTENVPAGWQTPPRIDVRPRRNNQWRDGDHHHSSSRRHRHLRVHQYEDTAARCADDNQISIAANLQSSRRRHYLHLCCDELRSDDGHRLFD